MKKIKVIVAVLYVIIFSVFNMVPALACDSDDDKSETSYTTEEDAALIGAKLLSEKEYIENDRVITEKVYEQADGTIITDTLNVGVNSFRSSSGQDTATRMRTISGWGWISITATFDWYSDGWVSYVRCSSMSTNRLLSSGVVVSTWDTSYTSNYVSIGSAKAQVEYHFYNSGNPLQFQEGTFRITCSDTGTINDNG